MSTAILPSKFSSAEHGFNTQLMHFKSCLLTLTNFLRCYTNMILCTSRNIGCLKFLVFLLPGCFGFLLNLLYFISLKSSYQE